jgi:hypothetical protein
MDKQEQRHQRKEKEREQKNKEQKVHEERAQQGRLPLSSTWVIVVGVVLVLAVIYFWTLGLW